MQNVTPSGLYIIRDQYFLDFPNDQYMDKTDDRPHFYALRDRDRILWMIPLSSRVEKYRSKIDEIERDNGTGSCFLYYIAKINGKERAILIRDMFPVTEEYILRPYTINEIPYIMKNKKDIEAIRKKTARYLSMVKRGKWKSQLNILETHQKLIGR